MDPLDEVAADEIRGWVETLLPFHKNALNGPEDFHTLFRSGAILCDLANYFVPRSIPGEKIHRGTVPTRCRETIGLFLASAEYLGITEVLFQIDDLYEAQNLSKVIECILEIQQMNSLCYYPDAGTEPFVLVPDPTSNVPAQKKLPPPPPAKPSNGSGGGMARGGAPPPPNAGGMARGGAPPPPNAAGGMPRGGAPPPPNAAGGMPRGGAPPPPNAGGMARGGAPPPPSARPQPTAEPEPEPEPEEEEPYEEPGSGLMDLRAQLAALDEEEDEIRRKIHEAEAEDIRKLGERAGFGMFQDILETVGQQELEENLKSLQPRKQLQRKTQPPPQMDQATQAMFQNDETVPLSTGDILASPTNKRVVTVAPKKVEDQALETPSSSTAPVQRTLITPDTPPQRPAESPRKSGFGFSLTPRKDKETSPRLSSPPTTPKKNESAQSSSGSRTPRSDDANPKTLTTRKSKRQVEEKKVITEIQKTSDVQLFRITFLHGTQETMKMLAYHESDTLVMLVQKACLSSNYSLDDYDIIQAEGKPIPNTYLKISELGVDHVKLQHKRPEQFMTISIVSDPTPPDSGHTPRSSRFGGFLRFGKK